MLIFTAHAALERVDGCEQIAPTARNAARCTRRLAAALIALAAPGAARAHALDDRAMPELWSFDPAGAALLALLALVYICGYRRLARRGRKAPGRRAAACFWGGWAALAAALGPPLESLTGVSFAAHMAQHEIMMLIAAPLLVIARPFGVLLWGLPLSARRALTALVQSRPLRAIAGWLWAPLVAWLIHALVLWGWHIPAAFEASLRSEAVHWLQHLSFFLAAAIFWWSVFSRGTGGERRGAALVSVFTTAVHTTVLGALLTVSERVWYATYREAPGLWGLTPLEDQQLGGLIMWVPGGAVFVIVGVALMGLWLKEAETRASAL